MGNGSSGNASRCCELRDDQCRTGRIAFAGERGEVLVGGCSLLAGEEIVIIRDQRTKTWTEAAGNPQQGREKSINL